MDHIYEVLQEFKNNYKGKFQFSNAEEFLSTLKTYLPILVWIGGNQYTANKTTLRNAPWHRFSLLNFSDIV